MVQIMRSAVINAPIDAVWRVLRDFNSHHLWHPAVAASEIEESLPADQPGCVRRFRLRDGAELREQLIQLSDRDFSPTPLHPGSGRSELLDYVATVRLRPVTDGERTFWEWRSTFRTPPGREDELAGMVAHDIYEAGFAALETFLGRGGGARLRGRAAGPAPSTYVNRRRGAIVGKDRRTMAARRCWSPRRCAWRSPVRARFACARRPSG